MLILVGVTINVALNGGLFDTTEWAADQTKTAAEKEQLLAAVLATIGTNGKVNFDKVVLPDGFDKVIGKNGVYKSKKSGITYTVNPETLYIEGGSGGSQSTSDSIKGTYSAFGVNEASGIDILELKSNGEIIIKQIATDSTTIPEKTYIEELDWIKSSYTYDDNSKTGKIVTIVEDEDDNGQAVTTTEESQFNYAEVKDENNNVINAILEISWNLFGDVMQRIVC